MSIPYDPLSLVNFLQLREAHYLLGNAHLIQYAIYYTLFLLYIIFQSCDLLCSILLAGGHMISINCSESIVPPIILAVVLLKLHALDGFAY